LFNNNLQKKKKSLLFTNIVNLLYNFSYYKTNFEIYIIIFNNKNIYIYTYI